MTKKKSEAAGKTTEVCKPRETGSMAEVPGPEVEAKKLPEVIIRKKSAAKPQKARVDTAAMKQEILNVGGRRVVVGGKQPPLPVEPRTPTPDSDRYLTVPDGAQIDCAKTVAVLNVMGKQIEKTVFKQGR